MDLVIKVLKWVCYWAIAHSTTGMLYLAYTANTPSEFRDAAIWAIVWGTSWKILPILREKDKPLG